MKGKNGKKRRNFYWKWRNDNKEGKKERKNKKHWGCLNITGKHITSYLLNILSFYVLLNYDTWDANDPSRAM